MDRNSYGRYPVKSTSPLTIEMLFLRACNSINHDVRMHLQVVVISLVFSLLLPCSIVEIKWREITNLIEIILSSFSCLFRLLSGSSCATEIIPRVYDLPGIDKYHRATLMSLVTKQICDLDYPAREARYKNVIT